MKRSAVLVVASVLALSSVGCFGRGNAGAVFATGLVVGSVIAHAASHHPEPVRSQQVTYVYVNAPPATYGPPLPASPRDRVPEDDDLPAFDAKAARGALGDVDLDACRAAGAPRGYGHALVTFNPSGDISKVVVDDPSGLPVSAVRCIGDELGKTRIKEYKGSAVTVGTTWFVP